MTHDAVVIGAGVNGLVAAWRLAAAGRRTLVLERRERVGGTLVTEEIAPGFRVDAARHDVGWIPAPVARALAARSPGLVLVRPDPAIVVPLADGEALSLSPDPAKSAAAIRRHSPRDAERWPAFARLRTRLSGFIESLYSAPPPRVPGEGFGDLVALARLAVRARRLGAADMIELLRTVPMPVADLLDDWFEHDALKGAVGAAGIKGILQGPRSGGTAFVLLHHGVGGGAVVVRGGVGTLSDALAALAKEAGAEIRIGVAVKEITIRGGRATGVVTSGGEEIAARVVVSGADPRATLLGLVHPIHLDPEVARAARHIRFRGAVAKVNLALDRLPAFRGVPDGGLAGAITIAPTLDYLERAYDDAKHGRRSERPFLEVRIPSVVDPGLAPAGKHVASIWVQYVPYSGEREAGSGERGADVGDITMRLLEDYAPGIGRLVLHRQVLTPADLEARFGLTEGSLYHGELGLDQILFMRPLGGWARYRTPIAGLYLCGA
ncbi:MAG: phytoene desaturase family protein, partial [Gemmatimonadales bacterium]